MSQIKYDAMAAILDSANESFEDLVESASGQQNTVFCRYSLEELLDGFALVYGSDIIYDVHRLLPMKATAFSLAVGRNSAKEWNAHPARRVVMPEQVVFDPTMRCSRDCINLFRGLTMTPVCGDWSALLELLEHLVSESADTEQERSEVLHFVLNWLAWPLQFPGAKMATALVFHGPQGVGKNLFFESYSKIFGEYAAIIGQAQLESRYNDVFSRKLFVIADEVSSSSDLNHAKNILKALITSPTIQIEAKFAATRSEANHVNLVFLSNEYRPLALERDDRRYVVIYCPPKRIDDLYTRVCKCIDQGGVEAMYEALLARDLSGFHPHTPAPMTKAKRDLVELGMRPPERFVNELLLGELDLPIHPCSTGQLYRAFCRWCRINGERVVSNQQQFTSNVTKLSKDRLEKRKTSPWNTSIGTPLTIWVPIGTGPLNGVSWFDFATEAVAAYELPLSRFCGGLEQ